MSRTQEKFAFTVFERTFKGLSVAGDPADNEVPFGSAYALYGLSKLSVWWLRLAVQIERIKPATRTKRAARADAFDAEEGSDQTGRGQRAAVGALGAE